MFLLHLVLHSSGKKPTQYGFVDKWAHIFSVVIFVSLEIDTDIWKKV